MDCRSEGSFTVESHATDGHRVYHRFDRIADDSTLRVIVLSLALGRVFSTGVDGTCAPCMPTL
jgi:hypothetical protein